jgi:hypothetical protein
MKRALNFADIKTRLDFCPLESAENELAMFRSLAIKYDLISRRLAEYIQKRKKNRQFGPIQDDAWRSLLLLSDQMRDRPHATL